MAGGDVDGVFREALRVVLRWEGGYSDDLQDPGGATQWGITQATYDGWRASQGLPRRPVREIAREEAEAIYRTLYWRPVAEPWAREGHPGIALYLFDTAVNTGAGRARRWAAELGEVLELYPLLGLARLHQRRIEHYTGLSTWPRFGRGWARRATDVYVRALELEHPRGLIRAHRLFLDGHEHPLAAARWIDRKLYVRRAG